MAGFEQQVSRTDVPIPETVSTEIIQELPQQSVSLTRMRRARMSTKTSTQPVLSALPDAYWLNSDTALKQTTKAAWSNLTITAEELAVLVPIPNAVVDDSSIPLWDEIRPLLVEAIGKKVDQATLFGTDKPTSWPTAIVPGAVAAGNTVAAGTGTDFAQDVAVVAGLVSEDGFAVNGFASRPGLNWKLIGTRDANGGLVYAPSLTEGQPGTLYGYPLNEVRNGAWDSAEAELLAADWDKFVVGVRQDFTFDLFDQMVISDDTGAVVFNAAQQDSKVMRVVFRVGFQVANPLTRVNSDEASRYPAGVVTPEEVEAG